MPAIIGTIGTIVKLNQAVNGNAASNAVYASQIAAGEAAAIAAYNSQLATASNSTLADSLMTNLSLTTAAGVNAASLATLKAAIIQALDAYPASKGQVIANLGNLLSNLESDSTWAPAALAFNNQTAANYSYSVNTSSTSAGSPSSTSTFTLSTNAENLVGSSVNDTYSATDTTLTAVDSINGGGGINTLVFAGGASYAGGATISNIQEIRVTSTAGGVFNASGLSGVTTLTNNSGSVATTQFNLVGALATLNALNVGTLATTLTYTEAALTGATDTQNITVTGAGTATGARHTINIDSATANTVGAETIAITASTTGSFITLATNDTSVTRINASGAAALDINISTNVTTTATTIDGSGMTAALSISGLGTAAHTVTGGTAGDTFAFGASLGTTDTIDGGTGTDTLSANGADLAGMTTTARATVSSIETLMIANDVAATATAINATNFGSSVSNVRIADQSTNDVADVTVNNLVAATTGSNNFRFDANTGAQGGSYTFNITNATNGGTANSANIDMRGAANTSLSTIVLNGVETLTISTAEATGTKTFNITDTALQSLTVSGVQSVDIDGAALGTNVGTVTASGLTNSAALNVALSTSAITSANITTGGGGDLIQATQLNDTIVSGSGNDTIQGNAGADTINVGSGTDTVRFITADTGAFTAPGTNTISTTTFDKVTGMAASDILILNAAGYTGTPGAAGNNVMVAATSAGNTLVGIGSANRVDLVRGNYDSAANTFVGSSSGTDSLLVYDGNAAQATTALEAIVLIGYTGATTTNAIDGSVTLG